MKIRGIDNLIKYHSEIEKKRFNLKYDIDELCIKLMTSIYKED